MTGRTARILFFSDSHLGFDLPQHPRIQRRRRGHDFSRNFHAVVEAALQNKISVVVHGGDLFYRSRIPPELTAEAFDTLSRLPDAGIPVVVIPGNHERSRMPNPLLAIRPGIHVLMTPRTVPVCSGGIRLNFAGFPYTRDIRSHFQTLVKQTGLNEAPADFTFLCIHQAVEGATVGVQNYTFRNGPEVIPIRSIPHTVDAVLAGHIHRAQILWTPEDSGSRRIPVVFAGSIERTAMAERNEDKGYFILEARLYTDGRRQLSRRFQTLPVRPMILIEIRDVEPELEDVTSGIVQRLSDVPRDAVVHIRYRADVSKTRQLPDIATLRQRLPGTMNLTLDIREV
ncbi:MAG TPA: metallophosphoesterase [bacterium]|nr:metallophosphoesterase [bacterium]